MIERQIETIKGEIDGSIELLEKTEGDKERIEQTIGNLLFFANIFLEKEKRRVAEKVYDGDLFFLTIC